MNQKRALAWTLVGVGLAGVVISYYGIWVIVALWATGLVWWANCALMFSGPVAAIGAFVAWRTPRQRLAFGLGLAASAAWVLLWVVCFTLLGFRWQGSDV